MRCLWLFTALSGVLPLAVAAQDLPWPITNALILQRGESTSITFAAPQTPPDSDALLLFQARLEFKEPAGYTPAMIMKLNGALLDGDRFVDRPRRAKSRDGRVDSLAAGDAITVFYAPDFEQADSHPRYGLRGGVKTCEFALRVTGLLQPDQNTLEISHIASVDSALVLANIRLAHRPKPAPAAEVIASPDVPLPMIAPRKAHRVDYTVDQVPGGLQIAVNGQEFLLTSKFSTPAPAWVSGSCSFFTHTRSLDQRDEAIVVIETFTNLTADNLPMMQWHEVQLKDAAATAWCSGLEQAGRDATLLIPENPTTFVANGAAGLGLLPLNDEFRVHIRNWAASEAAGIADNEFVLKPNATYRAEWAIIPTDAPDYWTFINAARRLVGANFTIDGGFAFLRSTPQTDEWTDDQIRDFIRLKDVRYVCASINYPLYNGHYTHGTSFQRVSHDNYRDAFTRWRSLVPGVQCLVYFHCFLDVCEDAPELFADARTLDASGTQLDYGEDYYRLFFPTDTNSYGHAVARNVDIILDEIKAEGVYWDEHEYSRHFYHFGEPWDGCSGDIDPDSMRIVRLKSSVTLLSEPWRVALAKRILARGPLIGNGAPHTRATAALKFPCFIETGSISNCTRAHLYSPIALGDHLTERNELDAYRVMLDALDFGCVYHWYNDLTVVPTHHHLTRYMFPITPLELHEGYVIGAERIVTKKSGRYGWGDASSHEVHVFDAQGMETTDASPGFSEVDGNTWTELRLPKDWSAAIVRVRENEDMKQ